MPTLTKLFQPLSLSGSAAYGEIYAAPADKLIDGLEFLMANTSQAERIVDLRLGEASSGRYQLYKGLVLPAGDLVNLSLRQVLPAGAKIWARASSDNAVTLHGSGLEQDAAGAVPLRLWRPNFLQAGVGDFYTVPANKKLINIELMLCHAGAAGSGNRQVNLYLTPSGRGTGLSHSAIGRRVVLPPRDTVRIPPRLVLDAGDKIQASADTSDVVALHGSGYLIDA